MPIQIGDVLGDYQVTGELGRGGMGKVYRVRNLLTDREEAMKIVLPDLGDRAELADRFLREMKVHASLQHPNIAALHTALRVGGRLVMILELVEGESLNDVLRRGPVDAGAAAGFMVQVLSALASAHERGVVHRDIKPANILIAAGGVVKLTDFGIARAQGGERLTVTGLAVGTVAYMSPEQIRAETVDGRSDLYSLGLTFYEMVTGRRAVEGEREHEMIHAQLYTIPPGPASVNPAVPAAISAAIMRAIAKEPSRRFQGAGEFAAALGAKMPAAAPPAGGSGAAAPELAALEARLSRYLGPIARRLVPDAARRYGSISEIRKALAAQIEDAREREEFLKTTAETAPEAAAARTPATPAPGGSFDTATVDRLTQALAPYVGPIAKVLVARAARTAPNVEALRNVLAAELPEGDRRRFLAALG